MCRVDWHRHRHLDTVRAVRDPPCSAATRQAISIASDSTPSRRQARRGCARRSTTCLPPRCKPVPCAPGPMRLCARSATPPGWARHPQDLLKRASNCRYRGRSSSGRSYRASCRRERSRQARRVHRSLEPQIRGWVSVARCLRCKQFDQPLVNLPADAPCSRLTQTADFEPFLVSTAVHWCARPTC